VSEVLPPGINCTIPLLGYAQGFGAFITNNNLIAYNAEFEGRVAVNGSAELNGYEIGTSLNCSNLAYSSSLQSSIVPNYTLIVGGNLNATNGRLTCGTFLTNGSVVSAPLSSSMGQQGDILATSGLDLSMVVSDLEFVSISLCAINKTIAATASSYGEVIFNQTNLNYTTGLNGSSLPLSTVFTVNASTLASANQVVLDLSASSNINTSIVVINVLGSVNGLMSFSNALINLQGLPPSNLVWNVCNATQVSLTNTEFMGSLLAPFSNLSLSNAQLEGTIVAGSLSSVGVQQVQAPFAGFYCPA